MRCAPITALALATMLAASATHAQTINKCMIAGHPVFQTSPCALEPRARPIPAAPPAPSGAPKKRTLAEMLRARDGGGRTEAAAPPPRSDGANILPQRMGAV